MTEPDEDRPLGTLRLRLMNLISTLLKFNAPVEVIVDSVLEEVQRGHNG